MPKPKKNFDLSDLTIGDRIFTNLHHGRTEEAVIKAILPDGDSKKFQVDYGHDETALIADWQVVEKL
jgi:hypothetical protein